MESSEISDSTAYSSEEETRTTDGLSDLGLRRQESVSFLTEVVTSVSSHLDVLKARPAPATPKERAIHSLEQQLEELKVRKIEERIVQIADFDELPDSEVDIGAQEDFLFDIYEIPELQAVRAELYRLRHTLAKQIHINKERHFSILNQSPSVVGTLVDLFNKMPESIHKISPELEDRVFTAVNNPNLPAGRHMSAMVRSIENYVKGFSTKPFRDVPTFLEKLAHFMVEHCHFSIDEELDVYHLCERHLFARCGSLLRQYVRMQNSNIEKSETLDRQYETFAHITQAQLGVAPELIDGAATPYSDTIMVLRTILLANSPKDKLTVLFRAFRATMRRAVEVAGGAAIGADDFIPVFIYAVLHAKIPELYIDLQTTICFKPYSEASSEFGYALTSCEFAVEFILNLRAEQLMVVEKPLSRPLLVPYIEPFLEWEESFAGVSVDRAEDGSPWMIQVAGLRLVLVEEWIFDPGAVTKLLLRRSATPGASVTLYRVRFSQDYSVPHLRVLERFFHMTQHPFVTIESFEDSDLPILNPALVQATTTLTFIPFRTGDSVLNSIRNASTNLSLKRLVSVPAFTAGHRGSMKLDSSLLDRVDQTGEDRFRELYDVPLETPTSKGIGALCGELQLLLKSLDCLAIFTPITAIPDDPTMKGLELFTQNYNISFAPSLQLTPETLGLPITLTPLHLNAMRVVIVALTDRLSLLTGNRIPYPWFDFDAFQDGVRSFQTRWKLYRNGLLTKDTTQKVCLQWARLSASLPPLPPPPADLADVMKLFTNTRERTRSRAPSIQHISDICASSVDQPFSLRNVALTMPPAIGLESKRPPLHQQEDFVLI